MSARQDGQALPSASSGFLPTKLLNHSFFYFWNESSNFTFLFVVSMEDLDELGLLEIFALSCKYLTYTARISVPLFVLLYYFIKLRTDM